MSSAKLALAAGLTALSLAACGSTVKPQAGTLKAAAKDRAAIDDGRASHVACLRQAHLPVLEYGRTWVQVGSKPYGPTINFTPTPGAAQEFQISGQVEGAEVIGAAMLYPNQAPDGLLHQVEACVATGVTG
ncbi:MAG: hypothetical protein WCB67_19465 [Solirubrobacteraceae bacterium]